MWFDLSKYANYELNQKLEIKLLWYIRKDIFSCLKDIDYNNLTDKQKLAIAILYGKEVEIEFENNQYTIKTKNKIDVSYDFVECKFLVIEEK